MTFLRSSNTLCGLTHTVRRNNIYDDVMHLYADGRVPKEYPFYIEFQGEKAVDIGGVSRDMFSAFFDEFYVKLCDGASLLYPTITSDLNHFQVVGSVISHSYIVSGVLPDRIAFPCLAFIFNKTVTESILRDTFVSSLCNYENQIVMKALSSSQYSNDLRSDLIDIFSAHGCRDIPNPGNIMQLLTKAAMYTFLTKPAAALLMLRHGVPVEHHSFWNSMPLEEFFSLYNAMSVSTVKVLSLLQEPYFRNEAEEDVWLFLRKCIGNMSSVELRHFLRFVTGSAVITVKGINVTFNKLSGLARRPISHTCTGTIELSSTYSSLPEFEAELKTVLHSEYSWTMDCI